MHRPLALTIAAAIVPLAASFWFLTEFFGPLTGYAAGLCFYWALLWALILRTTTPARRAELLVAHSPGRTITLLLGLPVILLGLVGMAALGDGTLSTGLLLLVALGAIVNGLTEELFWRGALLPEPLPDNRAVILALTLFTLWHVALFAAQGITFPGGPLTLLAGAGALGAIWMAARLQTGTVGAGVLSHVGVNLFAFTHFLTENLA
jgi:membrane protease YdiL (CAAX protease family)